MADRQVALSVVYKLDEENGVWSRPDAWSVGRSDVSLLETHLSRLLRQSADRSLFSTELRGRWSDLESQYELDAARANVLRPFEDFLTGDVLEVGAGSGVVSRYLGELGAAVVALESDAARARNAALRVTDLANVKVVCDSFDTFESDVKFDVITVLDAGEYAQDGSPADAFEAALARAATLLKPSGLLIVAAENRFGMKYFASAREPRRAAPLFSAQDGSRNENCYDVFSRARVQRALQLAGFGASEIAAAFPDHKLARSIVPSSACIADCPFDVSTLAAQSVLRDPSLGVSLHFAIERGWRAAGRSDLLVELANSLVYAARLEQPAKCLPESTLAWHFSTDRLPQFCKSTQFKLAAGGGVRVERRVIGTSATAGTDTNFFFVVEDEPLYGGHSLDADFQALVTTPGWNAAGLAQYFRRYIELIIAEAGARGHQIELPVNGSTMLPGSLLDFIPNNICVIESAQGGVPRYIGYDQEWHSRAEFPLGYLIFRSLLNLSGAISRYELPEDATLLKRRTFFAEVYRELGIEFVESICMDYWQRESEFLTFATGAPLPVGITEWFDSYLPTDREGATAYDGTASSHEVMELARQLSVAREKLAAADLRSKQLAGNLTIERSRTAALDEELEASKLQLAEERAALAKAREQLDTMGRRSAELAERVRRVQREMTILNGQYAEQCAKNAEFADALKMAQSSAKLSSERAFSLARGLRQFALVNADLKVQLLSAQSEQGRHFFSRVRGAVVKILRLRNHGHD